MFPLFRWDNYKIKFRLDETKCLLKVVIWKEERLTYHLKFYFFIFQCILNSGDVLFFPAFWWHQVTTLEDTISMNTFFGNPGTNIYLSKVMSGPQWDCFQYWLLNIIEQNRHTDRFVRLLQYLPEVIETFLLKQWKEVPSPEQLQTLVDVVHTYCGIDTNVKCTSLEKNKNPPPLKIRGLLWRS